METALAQGKVSEEDILYFARQDARAGLCEMEAVSLRGVTNFYFHYPEYSLKIIHDTQIIELYCFSELVSKPVLSDCKDFEFPFVWF